MRRVVAAHLRKAVEAARAAVECYNRPGPHFRTAQYLVLMCIAWTGLFHAIFYQQGRKPWYRRKCPKAIRYEKIDDEPKRWDLSKCMREYFDPSNPPERMNLQFIMGLRHKVEHRHLPELDATLYGECQACLSNFEDLLTAEFGRRFSIGKSLAMSLQLSGIDSEERERAIRKLASRSTKSVVDYVDRFRARLPDTVLGNRKYCFSVYLVPKLANRKSSADLAVEFVRYNPDNPDEVHELERIVALIREKQVPVANAGLLRPGVVVCRLRELVEVPVSLYLHTRAWRHYGVRPPRGATDPRLTRTEYCVYNEPYRNYLYTPKWVEFLAGELSDPDKYACIAGRLPASD